MLKVAYDPIYQHPLPEGHRFPMLKYELIPQQLVREGVISFENIFNPGCIQEKDILLTHVREYWFRMKNLELTEREMRVIGFPLSRELVLREMTIMQGTIDCALYAIKYGVALNVAGGTHHAFTNKGEGFCLLNDFAIAANYLLYHQIVNKVLIIDLDVHQGNGTAQIFKDDHRVFTFSMHGKDNYPFHKERSDMDIELEAGIMGEEYLTLLDTYLPEIFSAAQPQMVFYQSGVDVLATDKLGKLKLSVEACRMRDEKVLGMCKQKSVPVVVAMGGGYSPDIADIVNAHCNTFKVADKLFFH